MAPVTRARKAKERAEEEAQLSNNANIVEKKAEEKEVEEKQAEIQPSTAQAAHEEQGKVVPPSAAKLRQNKRKQTSKAAVGGKKKNTPKKAKKAKSSAKEKSEVVRKARTDSNCLISQHPADVEWQARSKRKHKGKAAFRKHMRHGLCTVIEADYELLDEENLKQHLMLPKVDACEHNASALLQKVTPTTRWTHFVDKNGIHFASMILSPGNEAFEASLMDLRRRMKELPRGAGNTAEVIRGKFHTWHLMLGGQDTACMPGPYWNRDFMEHPQMQEFLDAEAVKQIQAYCNTQFYECFPDHGSFYEYVGKSVSFKPYKAFKWGPCFPSLAVNEEANAISKPHRDRRDYLQGLAGVLSVGDYKNTTLNLHEANLSIDFPHGALAFFPSHVLHHYNTEIKEGETRGSLTMFMSSDLPKWIGYGGRAKECPDERKDEYKEVCKENWNLFKTIDDKLRWTE